MVWAKELLYPPINNHDNAPTMQVYGTCNGRRRYNAMLSVLAGGYRGGKKIKENAVGKIG